MLNRLSSLLVLGAALGIPTWAHADYAYGRVIRVEPAASFNYRDTRRGFAIQYDLGGQRYWMESDTYPGPWVAVPAVPAYAYPYRGEYRNGREDHHWWRGHDRDDHDDD